MTDATRIAELEAALKRSGESYCELLLELERLRQSPLASWQAEQQIADLQAQLAAAEALAKEWMDKACDVRFELEAAQHHLTRLDAAVREALVCLPNFEYGREKYARDILEHALAGGKEE